MTEQHAKYIRCTRCGTWRPKPATMCDDSGPVGLTEVVCRDAIWCKKRQESSTAGAPVVVAESSSR